MNVFLDCWRQFISSSQLLQKGDRKKAHWKKAHRKKAHRKKTHLYISAWEKSALGKKRTRKKRTCTCKYKLKIIFTSLLNNEQYSIVHYITLFIQRQLLFSIPLYIVILAAVVICPYSSNYRNTNNVLYS